jgi:hypothetical protein
MKNTKARAARLVKYLDSNGPQKEEYGFKNGEWTIEAGRTNYYAAMAKYQIKIY